MAIRYDKKLQKEIYKAVNNFNAKVKRLEKQGRELTPDKVSISDLKRTSESRAELRRKLNSLKRFSRRGAEDVISVGKGVPITRYEANEILIQYRTASRKLNTQLKKASTTAPKIFGKLQDATFKEMGSQLYTELQAKREILNKLSLKTIESSKTLKSFKNLLTRINKPYISSTFKNNYIDMLKGTAYYYGYDNDKIKEIEEKLSKLDDVSFTKLFNEEASIKAVMDYYLQLKMAQGVNPEFYKDDVKVLYDEFYDNLDEILQDYE